MLRPPKSKFEDALKGLSDEGGAGGEVVDESNSPGKAEESSVPEEMPVMEVGSVVYVRPLINKPNAGNFNHTPIDKGIPNAARPAVHKQRSAKSGYRLTPVWSVLNRVWADVLRLDAARLVYLNHHQQNERAEHTVRAVRVDTRVRFAYVEFQLQRYM